MISALNIFSRQLVIEILYVYKVDGSKERAQDREVSRKFN